MASPYMACLVKDNGTFLAHTAPGDESRHCLGETRNPLELTMLKEMKENPTVRWRAVTR